MRTSSCRVLALLFGVVLSLVAAETVLLDKPGADDPQRKISHHLRQQFAQPDGTASDRLLQSGSSAHSLRMRLDVPVTEANLAAIRATGATVVRTAARWNDVEIEATAAQAAALAQLGAVAQIQPLLKPRHRSTSQPGTFTDQADAVLGTDTLRTRFGVTGSGQKIGIISDSINLSSAVGTGTVTGTVPTAYLTGTTPQTSGDLPSSIQVIDFGDATNIGDTDEGAAMMELAYHLSPGATYLFSSCGTSQSAFASNITSLANQGCSIICDDIAYYSEPMFQDGPIAQAADAFVSSGGIYLSAAGNDGDDGILTSYVDVSPSSTDPRSSSYPTGVDFHDWGIGGSTPGFLPITITPYSGYTGEVYVILQWNQPYQSFSLGSGSHSDFDMFLFNATSAPSRSTLLAYSGNSQGTSTSPSGDPFEYLSFSTSTTKTVYLAIDRYNSETIATTFRVVFMTSACSVSLPSATTGYPAATIYGHPAATGALAIGAVRYSTPASVEYFSSMGGRDSAGLPFYYDTTGNALTGAPVRRNKPDFCAPDGTTTSLSSFDPFYGTSAAAPHAAAAAALLWNVFPTRTNTGIATLIEANATDLILKTTVSGGSLISESIASGADAWSGYGLAQPLAAAESTSSTTISSLSTTTSGTVHTGSIDIKVAFSDAVTVSGSPSLTLNTTPTNRAAVYLSGSGSSTLIFRYSLAAADYSADLDAASSTALSLNGGAILDSNHKAVKVAVPVGSSSGSLAGSGTVTVVAGPSTTISGLPTTATAGTSITVTITFSAAVTGFTASDISATNGTLGSLSGSGTTYQIPVTPASSGTLTLTIPDGAATDGNGTASFGTTTSVTVTAASSSSSSGGGGGGSGCGLGSGVALAGMWLAALGWLRFRRRRAA